MTIQVTNDNKIEQSIMTMEYSDWKLSAITELEEQGHHLRVGEKSEKSSHYQPEPGLQIHCFRLGQTKIHL